MWLSFEYSYLKSICFQLEGDIDIGRNEREDKNFQKILSTESPAANMSCQNVSIQEIHKPQLPIHSFSYESFFSLPHNGQLNSRLTGTRVQNVRRTRLLPRKKPIANTHHFFLPTATHVVHGITYTFIGTHHKFSSRLRPKRNTFFIPDRDIWISIAPAAMMIRWDGSDPGKIERGSRLAWILNRLIKINARPLMVG